MRVGNNTSGMSDTRGAGPVRIPRISHRRALLQTALIGAAGALLGMTVNAARPSGISLRAGAGGGACGSQLPVPRSITLTEAGALLGHQGVVFIDVRSADAYAQAHIAGAVRLPLGTPAPPAVAPLLGARTAIVYGESGGGAGGAGGQTDVEQVAARLASLGCREVRVLADGLTKWVAEGLPAQSGSGP